MKSEKPSSWSIDLTPILETAADCAAADEDYKKKAEHEKKCILEIADKIEGGKQLTNFEACYIAAFIKFAANQRSTDRKTKVGQPKQLPGDINIEFAVLIANGKKKTPAIKVIAEKYSVSTTAVEKKLKKMGAENFCRQFKVKPQK